MTETERDREIVSRMREYCRDIGETHAYFGASAETFAIQSVYRNAIAMCVFQIGELSIHLSDAFKQAHPQMPWRAMRGMRNIVAHQYGMVDRESLWITATEDIPVLQRFCETYLAQ